MNVIVVNNVNPSINFQGRKLVLKNKKDMPEQIIDGIYSSKAVQDFIDGTKKKNLFDKLINLFKTDETLEAEYFSKKVTDNLYRDSLSFGYYSKTQRKRYTIDAFYDKNKFVVSPVQKIVDRLSEIKDLEEYFTLH